MLAHGVAGGNIHLEFSTGPVEVISEFISGLERFSTRDATYKNRGALVQALSLEVDFTTKIYDTTLLIGFYFGQTWNALAFNVPQNSVAVILSTSFWKNTMMGLEYRHDTNYSVQCQTCVTGHRLPVPTANVNSHRNLVVLQFGAYF